MEQLKNRVGHLIKQSRIAKGLTQKELGEKLGVSESQVSRYESGTLNMTIEALYKIAEILDLDLSVNFNIR